MLLRSSFILLSLLSASLARAEDKVAQKPAAEAKMERLDLNQVDLEQVEGEWGSNSKEVEVKQSVRLKEIMEPTSEYNYASFGKPDPFQQPDFNVDALVNETTETNVQSVAPEGKDVIITSPLQAYPINDLSIKGVWQLSSGEIRAMVATPKGQGIVVKEGDPISSGKVLSIARDKVQVRLYRLRADGVREYQDSTMAIGLSKKVEKGVIKMEPGKDPTFVVPDADGSLTPAVPTPAAAGVGAPAAPTPPGGARLAPQGALAPAAPVAPAPAGAAATSTLVAPAPPATPAPAAPAAPAAANNPLSIFQGNQQTGKEAPRDRPSPRPGSVR